MPLSVAGPPPTISLLLSYLSTRCACNRRFPASPSISLHFILTHRSTTSNRPLSFLLQRSAGLASSPQKNLLTNQAAAPFSAPPHLYLPPTSISLLHPTQLHC